MPVITNYFRMDGWVKSAQGPAIPGAQIFVCSQPANTVALPPTPLANIFADVNGLVPITQPILTDGFGHYDFYAQAAVYTIVVGFGGLVQEFYPDQSLGGASGTSGGGSIPVIQVNGTNTGSQSLLDLIAGPGVSISDNGIGGITITGSSITLQTNGVTNVDQNTLNLVAGSNVTVSSDGSGNVTIASSGGGFDTPGVGGFWSAGYPLTAMYGFETTSGAVSTTNNQITVWQFTLQSSWTISKVACAVTSGISASTANFGIYSTSGNLLLDSGALDTSTSTTHPVNSITPVEIPSGTYYFACSSSSEFISVQVFELGSSSMENCINAFGTVKVGQAANLTVSGTLPTALGTITTDVSSINMPAAFFGV